MEEEEDGESAMAEAEVAAVRWSWQSNGAARKSKKKRRQETPRDSTSRAAQGAAGSSEQTDGARVRGRLQERQKH